MSSTIWPMGTMCNLPTPHRSTPLGMDRGRTRDVPLEARITANDTPHADSELPDSDMRNDLGRQVVAAPRSGRNVRRARGKHHQAIVEEGRPELHKGVNPPNREADRLWTLKESEKASTCRLQVVGRNRRSSDPKIAAQRRKLLTIDACNTSARHGRRSRHHTRQSFRAMTKHSFEPSRTTKYTSSRNIANKQQNLSRTSLVRHIDTYRNSSKDTSQYNSANAINIKPTRTTGHNYISERNLKNKRTQNRTTRHTLHIRSV